MLGVAHIIFNTAVAISLNMSVQQATGVAVGSLLPDLDLPQSTASKLIPGGQIGRLAIAAFLVGIGIEGRGLEKAAMLLGLFLLVTAFLPHRTLTHSLLGLGVVSAVALQMVPEYGMSIALGYALHLLEDVLTPSGIPVLWPFPWRLSLGLPSRLGDLLLLTGGAFLMFR